MIIVQVCVGSACHLKGSYDVINKLLDTIKRNKLEQHVIVKAAFCLGECTEAVSVKVSNGGIYSLSEDKVDSFLNDILDGGLSFEPTKLCEGKL